MAEWRDIPGYEGFYMASDQGDIRGVKRGQVKTTRPNISGYLCVQLYRDCKQKGIAVHRAVALAFVPGYEPGLEVNHIDGNRLNNAASNLEWVTSLENAEHARETGLIEYVPVLAIPKTPGVGFFFRSVHEATKHGFRSGNIYGVLNGRRPTYAGFMWVRPNIHPQPARSER